VAKPRSPFQIAVFRPAMRVVQLDVGEWRSYSSARRKADPFAAKQTWFNQ